MSQDIQQELKIIQSNKEKRTYLREAFYKSGKDIKTYALLQGEILENTHLRRFLEKQFISLAGPRAINIVGQKKSIYANYIKNPIIPTPYFIPFKGSWSTYNLDFPNLNTQNDESFLYLFMYLKTQQFYIGQTTDPNNFKIRLKNHRSNIAQRAIAIIEKKTNIQKNFYTEIAQDLIAEGNVFVYSAIYKTDQISLKERLALESQTILESYKIHNDRMYNKPTRKVLKVLRGTHFVDAGGIARPIKKKTLENVIFPCIINGIWYQSRHAAWASLDTHNVTLQKKLDNPNEPNSIYLKNTRGKKFPHNPEIQEKVKNFYDFIASLSN